MADTYANYAELSAVEVYGTDYEIHYKTVDGAKSIIFAPHGGGIEVGTSEVVKAVAKDFHNWYEFEGLKSSGNGVLHITSTNWDEPIGVSMLTSASHSMSIHGYSDSVNAHTQVGGLDIELRDIVIKELQKEGFSAGIATSALAGVEPNNITNRTTRGMGVQLELSTLQRKQFFLNENWSRSNRVNTTEIFKKYVKALRRAMNYSDAEFPFSFSKGGEQYKHLSDKVRTHLSYVSANSSGLTFSDTITNPQVTALNGELDLRSATTSNVVRIRGGANTLATFKDTLITMYKNVHPNGDNLYNLGNTYNRWGTVYAATGTIATSDKNAKQQITSIDDAVLDAWSEVNYQQFKFNDAVERKGEEARTHIGVIAQEIEEAFIRHGLDAFEYGLLCYDEWEDQYDIDDNGNEVLVTTAGSRYSIRPDECLMLESALMRREIKRLKDNIHLEPIAH